MNGILVAVVAKHADDVHMGATPEETKRTRKAVEDGFGPVTWEERSFVSVGVSHKQREDGTVELDQDAYIAQLVPNAGPSLLGKRADEKEDGDLQWSFNVPARSIGVRADHPALDQCVRGGAPATSSEGVVPPREATQCSSQSATEEPRTCSAAGHEVLIYPRRTLRLSICEGARKGVWHQRPEPPPQGSQRAAGWKFT